MFLGKTQALSAQQQLESIFQEINKANQGVFYFLSSVIGFPSSPCNQLLVRQTKGKGMRRERAEVMGDEKGRRTKAPGRAGRDSPGAASRSHVGVSVEL